MQSGTTSRQYTGVFVPRRGDSRTGQGRRVSLGLDPIDGTSNVVHGIPLCAVSLALLCGERAVVAAIVAPFL
ncbi:inositol monophosphatase family protein [Nocardia sp. NPDC058519]|uniref:inositol monophosphatase family protein n=1 Tax=unclassified Nocardia TaxID=2637762 RepID=UPI0036489077